MRTRWIALTLLAAGLGLTGCATDSALTQKEKDKLDRDMERENRRQERSQEKMMRSTNPGGPGASRAGR